MSKHNGERKEVFVYVFDVRGPNSPFYSVENNRRRLLLRKLEHSDGIKPSLVATGSKHHCGKEIARRCFKLGFSTVRDFLFYAREANFAEANVQADVLQERMDSFKKKVVDVLQSEVN